MKKIPHEITYVHTLVNLKICQEKKKKMTATGSNRTLETNFARENVMPNLNSKLFEGGKKKGKQKV